MSASGKMHRGSGNVFADIGVAHPQRILTRAQVMSWVAGFIKARGLTQKDAAALLGVSQSKVSCLMNGKLSMFSLDYLFELLNALDRDVEIIIKPKTKAEKSAATRVIVKQFHDISTHPSVSRIPDESVAGETLMKTHERTSTKALPVIYRNVLLNRRLAARDLGTADGQEKGWVHVLQHSWRRHYARRRRP